MKINIVSPHGSDINRGDIESDNVSNDNGENNGFHCNDNNYMDNADDVLLTSQTIFVSEQQIIMRMRY